jgi:HEAT repeat protein
VKPLAHALALVALVAAHASSALAAPATAPAAAQPAAAKPPMPSLAQLQAELSSGDEARVRKALALLAKRKLPGSVGVLTAFVQAGQSDALADRAIGALAELASPVALPVLTGLSRHRRPSARIAALTGVAALPGEAATALLVDGLRDSDPSVRGTSARLLGERGERSAVDVLFHALERGVPEAAAALGQLGDAAAVTRLHGLLGRVALQTMLSGYERLLARSDLDEAVKLEIVARLGEVAGLAVKRFLEQQLGAGVAARAPRLAHALRETAKRIVERPPAPEGRAP